MLIQETSETWVFKKIFCLSPWVSHFQPKRNQNLFQPYLAFRVQFSSVQLSRSVVSNSLRPHGLQHTRPLCPSPTPRAYSNSCPLSQWCNPATSSSVIPFVICLQSFPASGSFPMSQFFTFRYPKYWGFSFSISPSNEYSGLISFRIDWFDLLAVQETLESLLQHHSSKHQFFSAQPSLQSNSHIQTWLLEKPSGCVHAKSLSCVWLFSIPWTEAHHVPLSMGFST